MKEYLNGLIAEYEELKRMSEERVMIEYEANKAEVMREYEEEIDWYENELYKWYDYDRTWNFSSMRCIECKVLR